MRRLGCRKAQGFYFAKPLPADEITELIQQNLPFADLLPEATKSSLISPS